MSKQMNTRIQNKYDLEVNWNALEATLADEGKTFVPLQGEVIIYGTEVDENDILLTLEDGSSVLPEGRTEPYNYPRMKIGDGKTALGDLDFISGDSHSSLIKITNVPQVVSEYTYNGTTIRPTWINYDSDELLMGGQTAATNAGTYTVTFSPKNGYCWEDETTETKLVSWTIKRADSSPRIDGLSIKNVTLSIDNLEQEFDLTYNGNGSPQISEMNDVAYEDYVEVVITTDKKVIVKTKSYTQIDNVEELLFDIAIVGDSNYHTHHCELDVTLDLPHQDLNENSWDMIKKVSDAGLGSSVWNVGDVKAIQLNGTIGITTYADTANDINRYVYILGFNHNEEHEGKGIHFGGFKHLNTDQKTYIDYCLCDKYYGTSGPTSSSKPDYNKIFLWEGHSETDGNNFPTKWKTTFLRYGILGGVTSEDLETDFDMTTEDINNLSRDTLYNAIPQGLRDVLQLMTKYSAQDYSVSSQHIQNSIIREYITLPSACELYGIVDLPTVSTSKSVGAISNIERLYTKIYDYYKDGNAYIKYKCLDKTPDINTTAYYFIRSLFTHERSYIYNVLPTGGSNVAAINPDKGYGISPIFKV